MGWGTWLAFKQFERRPQKTDTSSLPPVSILKPLKGNDAGLFENLESFFNLDYPDYEIVFSVTEQTEPAIAVVQELLSKYPQIDAKLICEPQKTGPNPKINNLISAYELAKYDVILISDSNIRVKPAYLVNLVPDLRESVGIITAVVAGVSPQGLGGWLEASYLNTFFTRWMVFTKKLGFPSVIGKSMIFKKSTLKRLGGLKILGHYIAEDYMAGHGIQKLDLTVELMHSPIEQFIGNYSYKSFWSRHLRWGRIRKSIAPIAFLIEPFFFSTVSGALGAFALSSVFKCSPVLIWFLHMAMWGICDVVIYNLMDQVSWKSIGAWMIREGLALVLWVSIFSGNTVSWRGRDYHLLRGGLLSEGGGP